LSIASQGDPTPFLVLAGTFGRLDADSGKVYNEAVILNGRGNELFRQRKMHAYTMHGYEQPKYGLSLLFNGEPRTERMAIMPRVLVACDSPMLGLRISVLICEDFCQQTPGIEAVRKLRSNLVLSPVMAGALDQNSGFFQTTSQLVLDPECVVVVAYSRALPSQQRCASTNSCSLGIFGSPLYKPKAGRVHLMIESDPRVSLRFEIPN
jgi:predicted amidohydrolase